MVDFHFYQNDILTQFLFLMIEIWVSFISLTVRLRGGPDSSYLE